MKENGAGFLSFSSRLSSSFCCLCIHAAQSVVASVCVRVECMRIFFSKDFFSKSHPKVVFSLSIVTETGT